MRNSLLLILAAVSLLLLTGAFWVINEDALWDEVGDWQPYLQSLGRNSVTVNWRTQAQTASTIRYGTAPDALDHALGHQAQQRLHSQTLTGLKPNTQYFYQLPALGDDIYTFSTAPLPTTAKPVVAWVMGDSGKAGADVARVISGFNAHLGTEPLDMLLLLGDNAYRHGSYRQYETSFFNTFGGLLSETVVWSALGNHDIKTRRGKPYFDIFSFPQQAEIGGVASGTEKYYAFDYGNLHVISLDSELSSNAPGSRMYRWLERDLAANRLPWVVVVMHRPPYSKGSHDSDSPEESEMIAIRENLVPLFDRFGVDFVFAGHSHSYERSYPIKGHYGTSETFSPGMIKGYHAASHALYRSSAVAAERGTVYIVAGSASKLTPASLDHPAHAVSIAALGSVKLRIEGLRASISFISDEGLELDRFTVEKAGVAVP